MYKTNDYNKAVNLIGKSNRIVVLTGAGISTDSGIPDFRSTDNGLWKEINPMEALSTKVLYENPKQFYDIGFRIITSMKNAKPNKAHELLYDLENKGIIQLIITQNIDNLHFRAGSKNVYEVHGNSRTCSCTKCNESISITEMEEKVRRGEIPPKCFCGGVIRPDIIMFGDMLPDCFYKGMEEVKKADLLIAIGTSLTVYPVSHLAEICKKLIIINLTRTPYDYRSEVVISENISDALTKIHSFLIKDKM